MQNNKNKTLWRRAGIIAVMLPICFFLPFLLLVVGWLLWTIFEDIRTPIINDVQPPLTWRNVQAHDPHWISLFCEGCESPAEEKFLREMVSAFDLLPDNGQLRGPALILEMQVKVGSYRFDFLANGRQVIEIDGAAWHSSPEQQERDRIRDEFSVQQGYRVMRIPAKVVFNAPGKAIERVRETLIYTPIFIRPVRQKPITQIKNVTRYLSAINEGISSLDRYVTVASAKQLALSEFKLALHNEKCLLEMLVDETEREIRIDMMDPLSRKLFDDAKKRLEEMLEKTEKQSREQVYDWKSLMKPLPNNDSQIESLIEKEYQNDMDERAFWLKKLGDRCANDPEFSRRFRLKIEEAKFPYADTIFSG